MRTTWWKKPVPLWAVLVAVVVSIGIGAGSSGSDDELVAAQAETVALQARVASLESELDDGEVAVEETETVTEKPVTTTAAAPVTTTTTTAAPVTTVAPPTTAAQVVAAPPQALMPAIACGTDLQLAQDLVQEAGVYLSTSEDATGQGRNQVLDRNWTVVAVEPAAGTPISEGDPVFYVLKDEEFAGC